VLIVDSLSQNLDINTCRVISSNNSYYTEVYLPNTLLFHMKNANLSASVADYLNSISYLHWSLTPSVTFNSGDTILNQAGIILNNTGIQTSNNIFHTGKFPGPDTSVIINGNVISAVDTTKSYSWLDCVSNQLVPGQNSYSYTVSVNGTYSLIISDGCYSDTSACYTFLTTESILIDNEILFQCYPNPADIFTLVTSKSGGNFVIYNQLGEALTTYHMNGQYSMIIDLSILPKGIYFICNENGESIKLVVI
jgi:hypothetical protein